MRRATAWIAWTLVLGLAVGGAAAASAAGSVAEREPPPPPEELWRAAREGDVERVRDLVARGVPVDARTEFDCTALYFAANSNRPDVIRALLAAGADPNAADNSYGFGAVAMAGWLGNAEAVAVLLDVGVDPGSATGAFFAAVSNGHLDVVEVFLERDLIAAPQLGAALATALQTGHPEVAARLEAAGAQPPPAADEGAAHAEAEAAVEQAEAAETVARALDAELDRARPVASPRPWPEFRGAGRSGIADGQHPPAAWDLASGDNVRWMRPVEGLGLSSPVIWDGRVFVTTAVGLAAAVRERGELGNIDPVGEEGRHRWEVHAYDLASGALEWKAIARVGTPRGSRHWKSSRADPTCATDGEVLIASFGPEGLYGYDLDGRLLWKRELGRLNAGWYVDESFEWGYASSPILVGEKVIVQADGHDDAWVAAFDKRTGAELWRTERDELPSWGTPVVSRDGERPELVLSATRAVVGYDPESGAELWRIRGNSPITVASPLAQDGLIVATSGYRTPKRTWVLAAGRAEGDVTPEPGEGNDAVLWSSASEGVYIPTPILYRGILYMLRDNGVLTAVEAESGEQLYRERLPGRYTASMVAADGRIYATNEVGEVTVFAAGREFQELARNELDATTLATPAISDGMLVLRTAEGLVGVGFEGAPEPAADEPAAP